MITLLLGRLQSPIGELILVVDGAALCALDYAGYEARLHQLLRRRYGKYTCNEVSDLGSFNAALQAYFAGDYAAVDAIPVKLGGAPFQEQVWQALRTIPPGDVVTYGELANRLGKPTAARAVGMVNSLNPVAIVVPCHRVIGANASLTGYAGGLERKRWLLIHEGLELACLHTPKQLQPTLF